MILKSGERTMNSIAEELEIHWRTVVKVLEFLKDIGLVEERKGKKTYKHERWFRLKKN